MKKFLVIVLGIMMLVSLVSCGQTTQTTPEETAVAATEATGTEVAGTAAATDAGTENSVEIPANIAGRQLKFMLIYETAAGTYGSQFISGFTKQCEELGIEPIVSDAAGAEDKMVSFLDAAINQHVDAIIISHGRADALIPGVQRALEAGIPVLTKDVVLGLPDVPTVDQDDFLLGLMSVKAMAEDLNGEGSIVRAYAAGFVPQENRYALYKLLFSKYTGLQEVATFGPVSASTALDSQTKMEAILQQFPGEGEIDAVWAGWEEWAKGASKAIMDADRADEIKVYSVDISDETLQMLQDPNNPFTASVGVDPAMAAEVMVRMALKKVAGETVPRYYTFTAAIVRKSDLPTDQTVTTANLADYVPGWGIDNDFWTPWMQALADQTAQ